MRTETGPLSANRLKGNMAPREHANPGRRRESDVDIFGEPSVHRVPFETEKESEREPRDCVGRGDADALDERRDAAPNCQDTANKASRRDLSFCF